MRRKRHDPRQSPLSFLGDWQAADELDAERQAIVWVETGPREEVEAALRVTIREWDELTAGGRPKRM